MSFHGNSYQNKNLHLLYVIHDKDRGDIDKYGITDDEIKADGTCGRVQEQPGLFNRIAGRERFFAEILMTDIPGRKKAREIETTYIRAYFEEYGNMPPGNKKY